MKLFRTNRLTYEGLRISLDLYKLDKSENTKDTISFFAKTMIYDVIIDISLVVVLSLCVLQCISPDGRWFSWIFASAGVYGLELISKMVHQYYCYFNSSSTEERAWAILDYAPKYMLLTKREKELAFKGLAKGIEKADHTIYW